ncbi:FkbM family methyltransferase [uncultured Shimia sp.]|uniref:FkbM family methyltransferase n=1 Tax=uncultured Shimia sp. TaxID=573152 RepID=UPI0026030FA1|nr:FkbM family methyltransferase [uncultured Shimia sp.]
MTQESEVAAVFNGFKIPKSRYIKEGTGHRFEDGKYERKELEAGTALLREDDRIIEMGAGLGVVGGYLAYSKPTVELWSFEANPNLIPHIEEIYGLNDLGPRARVSNNVVLTEDDLPETIRFHIYGCYLGSSLFDRPDKPRPSVEVPTFAWSEICESYKPTFLLMDIEGGELDFLENADLSGLRTVVIEFHPDRYGIDGMKRCKRILRGAGFEPNKELSTRTVWGAVRS